MTERRARRTGQPESTHQIVSLGQLDRRVLSEVLVAQSLDSREAQRDRIVVERFGLAFVAGFVFVVGVEQKRHMFEFFVGHRLEDVSLRPEDREGAIEKGEVLGATNERGASRPIHGVTRLDAGATERLDEEENRSERCGEAHPAQHATESDGDAFG